MLDLIYVPFKSHFSLCFGLYTYQQFLWPGCTSQKIFIVSSNKKKKWFQLIQHLKIVL